MFEAFASAAHPMIAGIFASTESMGAAPMLSRQLCYMLLMLTANDAHRMISNAPQGNGAEDLAVEIDAFQHDVRKWEDQSKKTLDADIKMSVLIGGTQDQQVRQHLKLNAARLTDYPTLRAEILNFAVTHRT